MEPFAPKLIIVPTDFSDPAAHALRYAAALGKRFDAHLLVVFADHFLPAIDFTAAPAGAFDVSRDAIIEETREELKEWAAREVGTGIPYETRLVVDHPVEAIVDLVRLTGANLIVMGTHGRSGLRRLLFGSVTEAVMRTATVPVIAVNTSTSESGAVSKVLCPVSFTAVCRDALRRAAALTDSPAAPLVLFRQIADDDSETRIDALVRMQEWVPRELLDRCELKVVSTRPAAEQILDLALARHADLIALGISSDRTLGESLHGTVAERVVLRSTCPVLTINPLAARTSTVVEKARELTAV